MKQKSNSQRKKHIMHGLSEVAGQGCYAVLGLRQLGEDAQMVVWEQNVFHYPYDVLLNIDKRKKWLAPWYAIKVFAFFIYSLFRYNVYHFHYGRSFLLNKELWLLRLLKKRFVYEFHGSDLRNPELAYKKTGQPVFKDAVLNPKIKKKNEKICKYAKSIILHDDELISHLPDEHGDVFVVPLRVDPMQFTPVYPEVETDTIKIVHAPSKRSVKGTEYVISAVEKLNEKYNIELILVENTPQEEARRIYATADIIVDQLVIGTYGVFSIEGMALGKPVITYITDDMLERLPEELPIVSATGDTVFTVLEKLISDGSFRRNCGIAGRKYVEEYHDFRNIAQVLSDIYDDKLSAASGREAFDRVKQVSMQRLREGKQLS